MNNMNIRKVAGKVSPQLKASPQQKKKIMTLQNDFDNQNDRDIILLQQSLETPTEMYKKVVHQKLNQYFDHVEHSENYPKYNNLKQDLVNNKSNADQNAKGSQKKALINQNNKIQSQNNLKDKKNTSQKIQYNIYEAKDHEYGNLNQRDSQNQNYHPSPSQNQPFRKTSNSNKDRDDNQTQKVSRGRNTYQDKYYDNENDYYKQNNKYSDYYENNNNNQIQLQSSQVRQKRTSPKSNIRENSSQRQHPSTQFGNYMQQSTHENNKYGDNHIGKALFYEEIDEPNQYNTFHQQNKHTHSNKKLNVLEQTRDQNQNYDNIYHQYYNHNQSHVEVSPYSQKYHVNNSYNNRSSFNNNQSHENSSNRKNDENSDYELTYEDILYQGNDSYNEERQSQEHSNQKNDYHNSSSDKGSNQKQYLNQKKQLQKQNNNQNSQKKNNQQYHTQGKQNVQNNNTQEKYIPDQYVKVKQNQDQQYGLDKKYNHDKQNQVRFNNIDQYQDKYNQYSQDKINKDDKYIRNQLNNTQERSDQSHSNFVDDKNTSQEMYYEDSINSHNQSQTNNKARSQTHRVNNNEKRLQQERSSSNDRHSQSHQENIGEFKRQYDERDRPQKHEVKINNLFEDRLKRNDNSESQSHKIVQKYRKLSSGNNQVYSFEAGSIGSSNNLGISENNQAKGYQNQMKFEQYKNNQTNNLKQSGNNQNNLHQQHQQQLFINQLIQNAHSAHQSLEFDIQKISAEKNNLIYQQFQQNYESHNENNFLNSLQDLHKQQIPQVQQTQADINNIVTQQNLLIQNLIQQLLQMQQQQMTNTLNTNILNQSHIQGQLNDQQNNDNLQKGSQNMQQINLLLQQQIHSQQQKQQEQQYHNQSGINAIIQQLSPSNQQLLLNLLQNQQKPQNFLQNQQIGNLNNDLGFSQSSFGRTSSIPQALNFQDNSYNDILQSPAKMVETKLKDISEKQDDMARRLDQILDYSKNKLNSSMNSKNLNVQNFNEQNIFPHSREQPQKNLLRSKSQLSVYDKQNNIDTHEQPKKNQEVLYKEIQNRLKQNIQNKDLQDISNKELLKINPQDKITHTNFSKIMDDIIMKQEVKIKNLQKERKNSKIAKEQHDNSQSSYQQASSDDLVNKELSEIQMYIKNFQNQYNMIGSSNNQTKSHKDLQKLKNDSFDKISKENKQFINVTTPSTINNQSSQQNSATNMKYDNNLKQNIQRKRWGEDMSYLSNKQNEPLKLNEPETPQVAEGFTNQSDDKEIDDIKQRFKQDFKKYLDKSNANRQITNNNPKSIDYSPSEQTITQNINQQNRPNQIYMNNNQAQQQQTRSPKRWELPQSKQSTTALNQTPQQNQQQSTPVEKRSPQQWQISWEKEEGDKDKKVSKTLKSSNSRTELSPFNQNLQKKSGLNNIFEQNELKIEQKARSISQQNLQSQYQARQSQQPKMHVQESFKHEENYQPSSQFEIVFEEDANSRATKSKQSLADIFKSRKGDLADKLEDKRIKKAREKTVDMQQSTKTKEELAQIRKELLQQGRRRDLSVNNNQKNQTSHSRGRHDMRNLDMSFELKNEQKNDKSIKDPPPELLNRLIYGLKAKVDKKDYKKLTMKNYEQLPEIKKKKEEEKKKQEMVDRIKHKKEYEQKLRQRMKNIGSGNKSQMQLQQQNYNYTEQHQYFEYN